MNNETLLILSEECAEVVQAISKCQRFGLENIKPGSGKSNRGHLEEEIGDLLAMVELLVAEGTINKNNLEAARVAKFEKLKNWSSINIEILNK